MSKRRTAAIGFIFVTMLLDVIGLGIIIPVMPKLIMGLTGTDLSQASRIGGWLMFSYAFMQFVCAPILGGLSDRYGRRPILLGSLFGFGIDYLLCAFAPTIGWLFLGRILAGVMGSSFSTASAYIADISTPEKRGQNFGMIGAAFGLGFIIGPAIGGFLGTYGPRVPFFAAAILSLINWTYGMFILPESLAQENRRNFDWKRANPVGTLMQLRKYPVISGLLISLVLVYLSSGAIQGGWSYYTIKKFEWDEKMVGISMSVIGLFTAIIQGGLIRIIIPKLGQERGVYVGLALYSIGFILFAFASQGWMMFLFLVPYCFGSIAGPSLQTIISTQVAPNAQGELQSGLTSLMSASAVISPLMMSGIFAYFTSANAPILFPGAAMLTGAFLTCIAALLAFRTLHSKKVAVV